MGGAYPGDAYAMDHAYRLVEGEKNLLDRYTARAGEGMKASHRMQPRRSRHGAIAVSRPPSRSIMSDTNRRVLLKSRPEGPVTPDNFCFDEQSVTDPSDGQILVRNLYMSVDPYMRGRMNDVESYIPPFQIGQPLEAGVVGRVVKSRHPGFREGDHVSGMLRWEEYSTSDGKGLHKVDPARAPLSYHLGVLGMPGMTAYVGLVGIGQVKEGESVFVSAASGAVGSVAGQIAKIMGCRVAGSAGSDGKVAFLTDELGFDAGLNYKTLSLRPSEATRSRPSGAADSPFEAVREAVGGGIDVLFENVGGPIFEASIWNMKAGGRIALCGMIADYNMPPQDQPPGPRGLAVLIGRGIRMQGFIVFNYPKLCGEWVVKGARWLQEGKLKVRETVAEGLDQAPAAFIGLMQGKNFGKQIVKLA